MKKAKAEGCGATSQGNQTQGIPQRSESDARPRSAPGSEPQIAVRFVNGRYHGERPFAASRCDVSDADKTDEQYTCLGANPQSSHDVLSCRS